MPSTLTARLIGVGFLMATVTFLLGDSLIAAILTAPPAAPVPPATLLLGIVLELINIISVVGIAVGLFPILKPHHEPIALGYVGFRIMEAVLLSSALLSPLVISVVRADPAAMGGLAGASWPLLSTLARAWYDGAFQLAMIVLSVGSLPVWVVVARRRLVPRWLAALGVIGYGALLLSALLAIATLPTSMLLYLPGALFEILLPLWLIIKGFNPAALGASSRASDHSAGAPRGAERPPTPQS